MLAGALCATSDGARERSSCTHVGGRRRAVVTGRSTREGRAHDGGRPRGGSVRRAPRASRLAGGGPCGAPGQVRQQVRWRPGKAQLHLAKRVALGHVLTQATLATYEAVIQTVVQTPTAVVWVYHWGTDTYPTVVTEVAGVVWLVMCGSDGTMETAFPPEDPATYLADPRFTRLGTMEELGV